MKEQLLKLKRQVRIRTRIRNLWDMRPAPKKEPEDTLQKYLRRAPEGTRGLNLGSGKLLFDGWFNLDALYPHYVDLVWDLRRKLPFVADNTFDAVYSEHFLEHIDRKDGLELIRECFRVMRKGACIRIAVPDLDKVIRDYVENRKVPGVHGEFEKHYGGLFYSRGELLDIAMRGWGHRYLYNYEDLESLLKAAGFTGVRRVQHGRSDVPLMNGKECRTPEESNLIAEAFKPDSPR